MWVSTRASLITERQPKGRQGQNRTREIRPSGIAGGLVETWARVQAIRIHKAETPKQTSFYLRLRALHFYPDRRQGEYDGLP